MPIYEYDCQQCNHHFSKRRPMSAADQPADCSNCGSNNSKRALSLFAAPRQKATAGNAQSSCSGCSGGSCSSCST